MTAEEKTTSPSPPSESPPIIHTTPTLRQQCPFCAIAAASPALRGPLPVEHAASKASAHLILSTPSVLAFLDHAPITKGHTLLVIRTHRVKVGDLTVREAEAVGRWIGVMGRVVCGALRDQSKSRGEDGDGEKTKDDTLSEVGDEDVGDWNVVQNNGARAAQVVPHVHFHIIPRVEDPTDAKSMSWRAFGRGQREDLDDDEAEELVQQMRRRLLRELNRIEEKEGAVTVRHMFEDTAVEESSNLWEQRWSRL